MWGWICAHAWNILCFLYSCVALSSAPCFLFLFLPVSILISLLYFLWILCKAMDPDLWEYCWGGGRRVWRRKRRRLAEQSFNVEESFFSSAAFEFQASLRLLFVRSYPDPSGHFLPQSTNHILYSAVFCGTWFLRCNFLFSYPNRKLYLLLVTWQPERGWHNWFKKHLKQLTKLLPYDRLGEWMFVTWDWADLNNRYL